MNRPEIGHLTLLVYRECPCGEWVATGEGAQAPKCSKCDGWYVPGGGAKAADPPMFGSDSREARRLRGLGFIAFLTAEIPAVTAIGKIQRFLGLDVAATRARTNHLVYDERHYFKEECEAASDEIDDSTSEESAK